MASTVRAQTASSSNPYLSALIYRDGAWDGSTTVTYSFDTQEKAWTNTEIAAVEAGFQSWANVANITFSQVSDVASANIVVQLFTSAAMDGSEGAAQLPTFGAGDLGYWARFNFESESWGHINPGGDGYYTIVHELGHALGIEHPHDGGIVFPGVTNDQDRGTNDQNQAIFTVMSYVNGWTGQAAPNLASGQAVTPMAYDIATIQAIYGANTTYNTGNTTYTLFNADGTGVGWNGIWDAGGTDTITGATATASVTIDLRAAPLSGENGGGYVSWVSGVAGGYTVANGVTVENAIGGGGGDTLVGNAANNVFTGNAGNDTITGDAGLDTAVFATARANAQISQADNIITVNAGAAGFGTDTLTGVERLAFTDGTLAFDFDGAAGQTYRLYQAAFNRTPDQGGLSHNVNLMDGGLSIFDMANAFIASQEFQNTYGTNVTNTAFVTLLYQNVLNRAPDQAGLDGWLAQLDGGTERKNVLFGFSESGENKANVSAAISNGILLTGTVATTADDVV